jgi:hypothetical protein
MNFFALQLLFFAFASRLKSSLNITVPLHISSLPFSTVAGYRIAAPRLGCSSPFPAMPLPRPASLGNAVAKHIASIRSYSFAERGYSLLCHHFALPCNSFSPRLKAVP